MQVWLPGRSGASRVIAGARDWNDTGAHLLIDLVNEQKTPLYLSSWLCLRPVVNEGRFLQLQAQADRFSG